MADPTPSAPPTPERSRTMLDEYEAGQHAESRLEDAVLEVFGGLGNIWFHDWYFDPYDSSVELLDSEPGREPTAEQLIALRGLGLWRVFVSYRDNTAVEWTAVGDGSVWSAGKCGPRPARDDLSALLRSARAESAAHAEEVRRLTERLRALEVFAKWADESEDHAMPREARALGAVADPIYLALCGLSDLRRFVWEPVSDALGVHEYGDVVPAVRALRERPEQLCAIIEFLHENNRKAWNHTKERTTQLRSAEAEVARLREALAEAEKVVVLARRMERLTYYRDSTPPGYYRLGDVANGAETRKIMLTIRDLLRPLDAPPPSRPSGSSGSAVNLSDEATSEGQLSKPSGPQPAPRYDEVFFEGTAALDAEARGEVATCDQDYHVDSKVASGCACGFWPLRPAPSREED